MTGRFRGKRPILLVAPNGLALRNFLLNERVWPYLIDKFDVDVVTPVEIRNPSEWGIRKVIPSTPSGFLAKRAHWFNIRFLERLHTMNLAAFCLRGPEPEIFSLVLRRDAMRGDPARTLRWAVIKGSRLEKPLLWLVDRLNRIATGSILKRDAYQFVILGHSFTPDVSGFGLEANRTNIPVICNTLGHDNLLFPIQFRPDLLLVWGDADVHAFETSHRNHDSRFDDTKCVGIGSLSDDLFRTSEEVPEWDPTGPILVPAMDPLSEPDQIEVCEHLVNILENEELPNPVVIRVRPNVMMEEWKAFAERHRGRVSLQIPGSAAYDKSDAHLTFEKRTAAEEVSNYKSALQSASLVVTPGMTTVGLEAMSLKIPTIGVALERNDGVMTENSSSMWYRGRISRNPKWSKYKMSFTKQDFKAKVHDILVSGKADQYLGEEFVEHQLAATDGHTGDRWVRELESFLDGQAGSGN